jgi:P27 family predicted phage terminase small subunit
MGRPPKPTEQKRLEGNPGHHPKRTPVIVGGRITVDDLAGIRRPAHFNPVEARAWRDLLAPLVAGGILDRVDLTVLEMAAQALGRARQAREVIKREGLFGESSQGTHAHPAIGIEKGAMTEFRLLAVQLGIGPGARVRLGGEPGSGSLRTAYDGGMAGELDRQLPPAARLRVVGDDAGAD